MDELYYEIANCAFVEAHIMDTDNENARHTVADICQPGNRDRTDSVIRLAIAELCMPRQMALRNPHAREYIIACVLADWLGIAKPEAAARWRQRATTALTRARCHPPPPPTHVIEIHHGDTEDTEASCECSPRRHGGHGGFFI